MAFLLILGAIAKAAAVEDLEAPTIWTRNGGARCYTGHGATNIGSGSVGLLQALGGGYKEIASAIALLEELAKSAAAMMRDTPNRAPPSINRRW